MSMFAYMNFMNYSYYNGHSSQTIDTHITMMLYTLNAHRTFFVISHAVCGGAPCAFKSLCPGECLLNNQNECACYLNGLPYPPEL